MPTATKIRKTEGAEIKQAKKLDLKKILPFVIIAAVVLLLELTVFQYRYFHPMLTGAEPRVYQASDFTVSQSGKSLSITIDNIGTKVTSVSLLAQSSDYKLTASWYDEASSAKQVGIAKQMHCYTSRGGDYYLTTKGACKRLILNIETDNPITVNKIKLNSPAYSFNLLRAVIFSVAAIGLYIIFKSKPWKKGILTSSNSISDLAVMVYIIFMVAVLLLSPGMEANTEHCSIAKPFYSVPDKNDAYMMQTDALMKGKVTLDIIPSNELLALENPYDPSSRSGVPYTWDFAFYDGAYYSYFGIVPVVLILLPFRAITGVFLSSYLFAFMCGVAAAVMLALVYREAVRRYIPKINAFAYHIGLFTLLSGSFLAYLSARSWFYEIPYSSSLLCIFISLYLALKSDKAKHKALYAAASGMCYALAVGCRPIAVISVILLAPIIIDSLGKAYKYYICFALPIAVIGALLGIWNYIRFDSVFNFGNAYQLTVSDIRYNSMLDLPAALDGVYRYVFGEVDFSSEFPFFRAKWQDITSQAHSMYSQPVTGLIRYPIYFGVGLLPFIFKKDKKFGAVALCGVISAVAILFVAASSGGVCERYTLDFRWIFALMGTLCALKLMSVYGEKRTSLNLIFAVTCAISVAISLAICMMGEFNRMPTTAEGFYFVMRDTFELIY